MGKIADLIKAAGARADSVNPFVLELIMAAAGEEPEKEPDPAEHDYHPVEEPKLDPPPTGEEHHDPKE